MVGKVVSESEGGVFWKVGDRSGTVCLRWESKVWLEESGEERHSKLGRSEMDRVAV